MTQPGKTSEQAYQAAYYQRVTKGKRSGRWGRDSEYRESEQQRARRRRSLARAETADARFEAMVQAKRDQARKKMAERALHHKCLTCSAVAEKACRRVEAGHRDAAGFHPGRYRQGPTQVPRDVWIKGRSVRTYSSGSLAREIGRESRTIRLWLEREVLPGATVFVAVDTKPDAYFSVTYCAAVKEACRRLYRLDARFPRAKLRGLVLEELNRRGESYIPVGGVEDDRVWP